MIFALRDGNASRGELDRSAVETVTCRSFVTRFMALIVVYRGHNAPYRFTHGAGDQPHVKAQRKRNVFARLWNLQVTYLR